MTDTNNKLGIWLMISATLVFALQDGISRHLASNYNVLMIIMIRYWFFAAFVIALAMRQPGGIRKTAATSQPWLQAFRGALLALEICITVVAFVLLGLVEAHAIFVVYPLIVAALSGPVLGEGVGWRRWLAIGAGFVGVLVVLQPGYGVFSPVGLIPLAGAVAFALYGLLTRYAGRRDTTTTSLFWTGTVGALVMTVVGIWSWENMTSSDWIWMIVLSVTGIIGHWLLIRCYEVAEASVVQPFAYFQLMFVSIIGLTVFGETLRLNVAIGAAIVVAAGLFTLWRAHKT